MQLTLPIYIEAVKDKASGQVIHHCRPLFCQGPHGDDAHLGRAMSKLNKQLKQYLDTLGDRQRHDALASAAFSPPIETQQLKLSLDLRERRATCKLLFVTFGALGRQIAFTPAMSELWFEFGVSGTLAARATEVLTQHFKHSEKAARRSGLPADTPEANSLAGQAWVTTVEMRVKMEQSAVPDYKRLLASLFDDEKPDGALELQRVGRCLDWLYPDELYRAVAREREVAQLTRLLDAPDNRPIVLVGPRLSGKTTVLHQCVRGRVARHGKAYRDKRNVWLLSPQRLISGMMYVGQWEGRLQAILKTARKRRHVLYFDDFLGLYQSGQSRDANLSMADVLKPFILRREVRVLAEMTPAAWQVLQELDRGLADQFHVLRVDATSDAETQRIMIEVHRQLELDHRARFDLAALPLIVQLHRSYVRDAAFPGKSAAFSRRLAQKGRNQTIDHDAVLQEFHQQTGMSLALLDDRQRIDRDQIVRQLGAKVVGQRTAVEAAADVVTVAKARLAAADRPLATLLFLGPTGVGKTHCAKALAEVMFSEAKRLLRFDMNEYVSPYAVTQLVGTLAEPDGLLTSAVRRQPFSVVLLDEIEKAHPDVFDLLLQVTGEGRLTDALGRTADFSNTIVIMTSNLGVTAGGATIGLAPSAVGQQHQFVKAAENFFRPEFFNRIDRIIPFDALQRDQMRSIAELLLADVFKRDGLVRRRCALAVEPAAMEHIIDAGYHPQFGARALKRALEQQLVHPVAASLSGVKPELPAVINVLPQPHGVTARVHPLESVPPVDHGLVAELPAVEQLDRVERFVRRMRSEIEQARPEKTDDTTGIDAAQLRYYTLKEQLRTVSERVEHLAERFAARHSAPISPQIMPSSPHYERRLMGMSRRGISDRRVVREIHAAHDIHEYLREAAEAIPRPEELQQQLSELLHDAALLNTMHTSAGMPEEVLLIARPLSSYSYQFGLWFNLLRVALEHLLDYDCLTASADKSFPTCQAMRLAGPGVWSLVGLEAGVHVFCQRHENLLPVQVSVIPGDGRSADEQAREFHERRRQWLAGVAAGTASLTSDPSPLGPIVRFYDESGPTLDVRTGISLTNIPSPLEWKRLLLAGLPLPMELEAHS